MKCIHCGSQWSSTTSVTKCPFCGKSLSASTQNTKTLTSTLVEVRELMGVQALGNGKVLVSSFKDLAPMLKKEYTMLSYLEKCDGIAELFKARDKSVAERESAVAKVVRRMADELMVSESAAQMVCHDYMLVVSGREKEAEAIAAQKVQADKQKEQEALAAQRLEVAAALAAAAKAIPIPSAGQAASTPKPAVPARKPVEPPKPAQHPPVKAAAPVSPDTQKKTDKAAADVLAKPSAASGQKSKQDAPVTKPAASAQKPAPAKTAAAVSPQMQKMIDDAVKETVEKYRTAPSTPKSSPKKNRSKLFSLLASAMWIIWGLAFLINLIAAKEINTDGSFFLMIPVGLVFLWSGHTLVKNKHPVFGIFFLFFSVAFAVTFYAELPVPAEAAGVLSMVMAILCITSGICHGIRARDN